MSTQTCSADLDAPLSRGRVHVVGAGPVGLLLAALLQSTDGYTVHLYEKRRSYTRTRMVKLAPYLVADSVASYCTDDIDEESIAAIFDPSEVDAGLAFRRAVPGPRIVALVIEVEVVGVRLEDFPFHTLQPTVTPAAHEA